MTIQERLGQTLTARSRWTCTAVSLNGQGISKPPRQAGVEIERAVAKREEELYAEKAESFVSLNAVNENGLGGAIS